MSKDEQIMAFADELDKLVHRQRMEFDVSYASIIGVLEAKKWFLIKEASERRDEV